jgi:hypothetical protein
MKFINVLIFLCLIALFSSLLRKNRKSKFKSLRALNALSSEAVLAKFDNDICGRTAEKIMDLMADNIQKSLYKEITKKAERVTRNLMAGFGIQDDELREQREIDLPANQAQAIEAVRTIPQLLDAGKIIKIEIKRDHHFVLLKDGRGGDNIFIWQSYVGTYHLRDWIQNAPNQGSYLTANEIVNFLEILFDNSLSKAQKLEAELALFAPRQVIGYSSSTAQEVVENWFGSNPIILSSIWSGDLASELPKKTRWEKVLSCFCSCSADQTVDENEINLKK